MEFFTQYFELEGVSPSPQGEYTVLCPFEHKDRNGNLYKESNPSAHISEGKSTFHCKSCGEGMSEVAFVGRIEGLGYQQSLSFLDTMKKAGGGDWQVSQNTLLGSQPTLDIIKDMGIDSLIDTLRLGFVGEGVAFPVFVYGNLLDVRSYSPNTKPKVKSRSGAKNLIVPFDLWREDDRPTLLCAGEKDMAIARVMGFNSITFTGGEMSFPKLFKHSFKGRRIYIAYDNDSTGEDGAQRAAYELKEIGADVRIVTGHFDVCVEQGEDIHDYFMKYGKTAEDFQKILDATGELNLEQHEKIKNTVYPRIPIERASEGQFVDKRFVRSRVNTISIFEDMFSVPDYVQFTKYAEGAGNMELDDEVEWLLDSDNLEEVLYLMDSNLTKAKQSAELRRLAGISKAEEFVNMRIRSTTNVWKSVVSDVAEGKSDDVKASQLLIYSVGQRMLAGKKYDMHYKPTAHPLDGMRVVGIASVLEDIDSDVQQFEVTDAIKDRLKVFQVGYGETVEDKMKELAERAKGFVGVEARQEVTWATDMFYHTPLYFKLGKRTERAYLDAMIIGDPRTMKSATAKAMHEMYELGTITSLKTATVAGLIGGSDNVGGKGWKTKIGLLPRNHRSAVIMEEFSDGGRQVASMLTEIRSSNRVRIERVDGSTDVPAMVRMLTISNPAKSGGITHALRQYPSGIPIILDLVGASEDIARYDFFLLVDEPDGYISPLDMFDLEPYEKDAYMDRVRWIWSRSADNVELERSVAQYVVDQSTKLNKDYDSHIKLFGAEAWKKVSRCAIAVAGLLVSTDESFEKLIVRTEHVDFAVAFLKGLYDNQLFKLREYVENERSYSMCREVDINTLQELYSSHAAMLEQMAISTELTQRQLQLISGLDNKEFPTVVNRLGASRFIQWQGEKIIPTGKFRQAIQKIDKDMYVKKASER